MVKLRQKKGCRQQTVSPKNSLSYRIAARFLRTGRLFLRLRFRITSSSIFANGISNTERGQHKADYPDQSYFLTTSALKKQAELNAAYGSPDHVTIVTMAKSNYVAYRKPAPRAPGTKGRPRLKGDTVKLSDLLNDDSRYRKAQALLYGKRKEIAYFYEDLLWGQKLYQEMRFVFVKYDGMKSIFVCTDLTIDPVRIAELYGFRFNIERCFREFKQQLGGFCYHFWTKHMPRLNHYAIKGERDPLARVADKEDQKAILATVKAIEGFVLFSSIAMGILQMMSLMVSDSRFCGGRYLRTQPENGDSEATVMSYMRRNIF